jgi:hypothetical protein
MESGPEKATPPTRRQVRTTTSPTGSAMKAARGRLESGGMNVKSLKAF